MRLSDHNCPKDRNGYVWTLVDGVWKPTLVLLRINRAATCVRWSPKEDKLAVGCGAKLISVCYFEEQNDWWVSKHIKKSIKSTVTSIDWHPNNALLACGSTDFRTRVFTAYVRDVDNSINADEVKATWNGKTDIGTMLAEFHSSQGGGLLLLIIYCCSSIIVGSRRLGSLCGFFARRYSIGLGVS